MANATVEAKKPPLRVTSSTKRGAFPMNLMPIIQMTHILALLIIILPVRFSFAFDGDKVFFSSLDSTIQSQGEAIPSKKKLIVERYLRLLARLSIFGLYCDHNNRMGYSTRVSVLQRGSVRLEKWTEEIFGNVGAYNRFEKYRSQESLRYVQSERTHTCNISEEQFLFFTDMAPKDFRIYLSSPPFGSL
jgi:hypothetical protein